MTLLLASVTGADEALTALAHGADIIDLKDVSQNALTGLPLADVRATVSAVAGRRPVSAVVGCDTMDPDALVAAVAALGGIGVDFIKMALPPGPGLPSCLRALAPLARRLKLIGVKFADMNPDDTLIPLLAECGFAGVMFDTVHKDSGRLLDHKDIAALSAFVAAGRGAGLMVGLAGSLEPPDIPRLLLLAPDLLGFRGALCAGGGRTNRLDPAAMRMIRDLIPAGSDARQSVRRAARLEARIPAAPWLAGAAADTTATDRIFVHDLVMPVRIGAYAREHSRTQNVRFNVDVWVARPGRATDMRDVLSYDLIADGIKIITAHDHVALAEDLAERIADFILAYPSVVATTIRIEKLDVGPGAVGVEISRRRRPDVAKVHQLFPAALGGAQAAE
jgi:(5-formylfuran-3-yl)methyl phosphate synthase